MAVLSRAQVRFHDRAVEMPSRMGEHRQHQREPNEERQRADHQGDSDEEPSGRHHQRIVKNQQRLVEPLCGGEPDQEHDHQEHVSFPLLLDRDVGAMVAVHTSVRATRLRPF